MRRFLVLLAVLFFATKVFAYELILPKEKKSITTSNYALFVGQAKSYESLKINDQFVYIASNGAFAHTVKLKEGENRIALRTAYGIEVFRFYKTSPEKMQIPTEDFDPIKVYVNKDNTPLRSTPTDAGLNRISHLFGGTNLIINGSKGSFYRVFLSKNKVAWILKSDVTLTNETFCPADFLNMDSERYKNAMVQTISFTRKLPYTVEDCEKEIIFRVYNPELSEESVYTLNIPKPEKYAYKVSLEEGTYTFKVRKLTDDAKEAVIVIDAGHGGSEKGAVGCLGDEEKDINLQIALQTEKILKKQGFNVIMTRECDADVSLQDRIRTAIDNNADIFVSIHLNSIGDVPMNIHKNRGTSVYYFNNSSQQLAEIMEQEVTNHANTHNDKVRTASFAVIRPTEYVGVLVGTAYMINPMDTVLYTNKKWIANAAKGISEGIIKYLKN